MQTPTPTPPQPPRVQTGGQASTAPVTAASPTAAVDINTVRLRLSQLRTELDMAQDQQSQILHTMERAVPAAQPGLQQQLATVQQQIVSIEGEITATQAQITTAVNTHTEVAAPQDYNYPVRIIEHGWDPGFIVAIVFFVVVLGPISLALGRRITRKGTPPALPPGFAETPERMGRLEQAVDAVAIEVERISENQRFLTRVLAEREHLGGVLPSGEPGAGSAA